MAKRYASMSLASRAVTFERAIVMATSVLPREARAMLAYVVANFPHGPHPGHRHHPRD